MAYRRIRLTEHARFQAQRRNIPVELILEATESPQQMVTTPEGRVILQSRYQDAALGREMLLRVVAEAQGEELMVITAYKTSKIERYWEEQ